MKLFVSAILISFAWAGFAQTFPLTGDVFSDDGSPMVFRNKLQKYFDSGWGKRPWNSDYENQAT